MHINVVLSLQENSKIGITSSSEFASEGGMPTFDSIPFKVEPGKQPSLNTFVVVLRHEDDSVAHYGRIISGNEWNRRANPAGMQKASAYGMARTDIRTSEISPEILRVMQIEILGEIHVGVGDNENGLKFSEPIQLPHTGQPVYELPAQIIPLLLDVPDYQYDRSEGVHLGDIESGGQRVPFLLPNDAIARHIAILGKTGVGKSYAAGVLMEELYEKNIPMLSFDVLGDTEQTAKDLKGVHIIAGDNDFKIPYSIVGLQEFLAFIPNLTSDQRDLIASAYGMMFDKAIQQLEDGKKLNVPFSDLTKAVKNIGKKISSKATDNAVNRVTTAYNRSNLLTDQPIRWPRMIADNPLLNIYVGHLGQEKRNLAVGAAARILQLLRRRNLVPPIVLIIDEAHLFLPSGRDLPSSTIVLREMIRTARHDAMGVVLLTQSPSSMDKQILLTCNTRVLFALDPDDLRVVSGQLGDLPEETIKRIPRLARGTSVISSGMDIMRHPVIVRIRERKITSHKAETPDLMKAVKAWRNQN
ncbi:ATP-binding protein [Anaerolineales bacterium HSG24]|nr:ATP-binding protein [Anaerolineales bacterium HSG24]